MERERHTHTEAEIHHSVRARMCALYYSGYVCVYYITVSECVHVCVCVYYISTWVCVTVQDVSEPSVQLKLQVKNPDSGEVKPVAFTISANKFRVLLNGKPIYFRLQPLCVHVHFICVYMCICLSVCVCNI